MGREYDKSEEPLRKVDAIDQATQVADQARSRLADEALPKYGERLPVRRQLDENHWIEKGPKGEETWGKRGGPVITEYPDGSWKRVDPDGTISTKSKGVLTMKYPDGRSEMSNPDGSRITETPNGVRRTEYPSHHPERQYKGIVSVTTKQGSSEKVTVTTDGNTTTEWPNGLKIVKTPDGKSTFHIPPPKLRIKS